MSEWQPIDTAPKDGTAILVYAKRKGWERAGYSIVAACHYHHQWQIYGCAGGYPTELKNERNSNLSDPLMAAQWLDQVLPTHWQPLPTPPNTKE